MTGIQEFEKQCMQYLNSLNDEFFTNPRIIAVNKYALGEKLNLDKLTTDRIVKYLLNKGALKGIEGESIKITTQGIDQLMRYEKENQKIPAAASYSVNVQNMTGSNIVQGSRDTHITNIPTQNQLAEISQLVSSLRDIIVQPELLEEQKAELNTEIETLASQLKAPKPKIERIKDCLTSAKNILEGSAGGAIVASRIAAFLSTLG